MNKEHVVLQWKGKRPFRSTQYFPAQLKENHGEPTNGWMNKIFWGDNLQVMSHLLKEYRGKVQLIYIDPPFDSKADYKKKIELRGKTAANDHTSFEEKQYTDIWTNDEYLQFMYERLILMRELLSDTGSIYIHCDWHKSHLLRCVMDEIFGVGNFAREIVWNRGNPSGGKAAANNWIHAHDTILFYSKTQEKIFNKLYEPYTQEYIAQRFINNDNDGNGPYRLQGSGDNLRKQYLKDSKGKAYTSVWDLPDINVMATERSNYPTQKPEALIERIIKASSNSGDLVFDCFMGSGTTQAVAMKLGRRFIGADINLGAIQITTKRLLEVAKGINMELPIEEKRKYTKFEIFYMKEQENHVARCTAKVAVENGNLVIKEFYPFELIQKFKRKKEDFSDCRQLIDSVMIDWNYDGEVLRPTEYDIPKKGDMVKGVYAIPADAGLIRVKITDLIAQSVEISVDMKNVCKNNL